MSNPNPPGTPVADPIQQAIDQIAKPAAPIEINLSTGQVYKGATHEDVLRTLASAQEEATRTIRAREAENAELRNRMAAVEAQIPKPQPDTSAVKDAAYYETWAKDPAEATRMQLAEMLGIPKENVVDVLKAVVENGVVTKAADEFIMRNPDFPQSPASAALMKETLKQRFGQTINNTTADNLELVYGQLKREGKLQPVYPQTQSIASPNQVMPNLRGGGAPPNPVNDVMAQAQSMPLDKLKEVIDRLNAQTQAR